MAIRYDCESCGRANPKDPELRAPVPMDYCVHCSKDLCNVCLKDGFCHESTNGKHAPSLSETE